MTLFRNALLLMFCGALSVGSSSWARGKMPRELQVLVYGWYPSSTAITADGRYFAFTDRQGQHTILETARRKVVWTVKAGQIPQACLVWSPDGTRLAYVREEDGSGALFIHDLKSKTSTRIADQTGCDGCNGCSFGFGRDGKLRYLQGAWGSGEDLRLNKEGETTPVFRLPYGKPPRIVSVKFAAPGTQDPDYLPLLALQRAPPLHDTTNPAREWAVVNYETGQARFYKDTWGLMSGNGTKLCEFKNGGGLRCLDYKSNAWRQVILPRGSNQSWGEGENTKEAYSPSGKRVAFFSFSGDIRDVMVHDFELGQTRTVLRACPYRGLGFQSETELVLFENWDCGLKAAGDGKPCDFGCRQGSKGWIIRRCPAITRVDLATQKTEHLIIDETTYNHPEFIPSNSASFFFNRDRGSLGDLVHVKLGHKEKKANRRPR